MEFFLLCQKTIFKEQIDVVISMKTTPKIKLRILSMVLNLDLEWNIHMAIVKSFNPFFIVKTPFYLEF